MWSLDSLNAINQQAAARARRAHKQPHTFTAAQLAHALVNRGEGVSIPSLGSYTPPGWVDASPGGEAWFVSKMWEGDGGPAMSIKRMMEYMLEFVQEDPRYAFAVVDEGPFQVYVGAFLPEGRDAR